MAAGHRPAQATLGQVATQAPQALAAFRNAVAAILRINGWPYLPYGFRYCRINLQIPLLSSADPAEQAVPLTTAWAFLQAWLRGAVADSPFFHIQPDFVHGDAILAHPKV